jgi:hypothetical protein
LKNRFTVKRLCKPFFVCFTERVEKLSGSVRQDIKKIIQFLDEWMTDESGYDEKA